MLLFLLYTKNEMTSMSVANFKQFECKISNAGHRKTSAIICLRLNWCVIEKCRAPLCTLGLALLYVTWLTPCACVNVAPLELALRCVVALYLRWIIRAPLDLLVRSKGALRSYCFSYFCTLEFWPPVRYVPWYLYWVLSWPFCPSSKRMK